MAATVSLVASNLMAPLVLYKCKVLFDGDESVTVNTGLSEILTYGVTNIDHAATFQFETSVSGSKITCSGTNTKYAYIFAIGTA